ncbi:MAG TPA: TldD/PmbA family protein, partial [Planctomycetota bacterium]|nr:TldD/PmbA family protein [Planctomycetota bacterium]
MIPRTPADVLELAEHAVARALAAGADEAEACVARSRGSSVTLQKNDVQSGSGEDETVVGVRVFKGGAIGFATVNDPEQIDAAAAEALALARVAPPDPLNGPADPETAAPLGGLADPALEAVDVGDLVDAAAEMLAQVRSEDARVRVDSGSVSVDFLLRAVANSRGVRAAESQATASGSLFGMAVDGDDVGSFDAEGDVVRKAADLRTALRAASARFVAKTVGALGARRGESFKGAVILAPEVVAEFLLGNLAATLSAKAVRNRKSPFAGRLGERIADARLTLLDDPRDPSRAASAGFDREGTATRTRPLVEHGVLKGFFYDAYEARAANARPTGSARGGASSSPSPGPWNLSLAAGATPFARL